MMWVCSWFRILVAAFIQTGDLICCRHVRRWLGLGIDLKWLGRGQPIGQGIGPGVSFLKQCIGSIQKMYVRTKAKNGMHQKIFWQFHTIRHHQFPLSKMFVSMGQSFSHQVCLYTSQLLCGKWHAPLSGLVLYAQNVYKWDPRSPGTASGFETKFCSGQTL